MLADCPSMPSFPPYTYLYWFISFPLVSWVLSFLIRILRMFMKKMKLICKAQGKGQAKGVWALTPRAGDRRDATAR